MTINNQPSRDSRNREFNNTLIQASLPKSLVTSLKQRRHEIKLSQYKLLHGRLWRYLESIIYLEEINTRLIAEIKNLKELVNKDQETDQTKNLLKETNVSQEMENISKFNEYKYKCYRLNLELAANFSQIYPLSNHNDELVFQKDLVLESISLTNARILNNNSQLKSVLSNLMEFNTKFENELQIQNELYGSIERLQVDILFHDMINEELARFNTGNKATQNLELKYQSIKGCLPKIIKNVKAKLDLKLADNRDELAECYAEKLKKAVFQINYESAGNNLTLLKSILDKYLEIYSQEKSFNETLNKKSIKLCEKLENVQSERIESCTKYDSAIHYFKANALDQLEVFNLEKETLQAEIDLYRQLIDTNRKPRKKIHHIRNRGKTYGPVGIAEISADFKCLVLTNQNGADEYDLSKWVLKQRVDDNDECESIVFELPVGTSIRPKSKLFVWSNIEILAKNPSKNVINRDVEEWARSDTVETRLFDDESHLRSILLQNVEFKT
jgi:hypothetical protein